MERGCRLLRELVNTSTLDNAVWHALDHPPPRRSPRWPARPGATTPTSRSSGRSATPDETAWRDLAALVGPGGQAVLFRVELPEPSGGLDPPRGRRRPPDGAGRARAGRRSRRPARSGPATSAEMLALIELTRPGPFAARTIELGDYLGVFEGGELVAMAGERLRLPGFCEISAVCTRPDHRGRGLAAGLTALVAQRIIDARRTALPPPRGRQRPGPSGLRGARLRVPAGGRLRRVRRALTSYRNRSFSFRRRRRARR